MGRKRSNSKSRHVQVLGSQRWCCGGDTVPAVGDFSKKHCHPDAWTAALTRPESATTHWLKKLDMEPADMFPPRFSGNERIEVVARVQRDSLEKVLRGSGEFGVFSRTFFVKGEPRVYKDVPLPDNFDLRWLYGSSLHARNGWMPCSRHCRAAPGARGVGAVDCHH